MTYPKALYAGSFDPPTLGHMEVIEEAGKLFDLTVVVAPNSSKSSSLMSVDERVALLDSMGVGDRVVKLDSADFTAEYAQRNGIKYMVRGLRSGKDFEFEHQLETFNRRIAPGVTTVYFTPSRELSEVSSSVVRSLIGPVGWPNLVRDLVPPRVFTALIKTYIRNFIAWNWTPIDPPALDEILNMYESEGRAYHNLEHIVHCYTELNRVVKSITDKKSREALIVAILYHDAVYNPFNPAGSNELKSAELVEESRLSGYVRNTEFCKHLIYLTADHTTTQELKYHAEDVMLDVDMAILGRPSEEYKRYVAAIREEYREVSDAQFKMGRAGFLLKLLERGEKLYYSTFFRDLYLNQAHQNIRWELSQLEK